MSGQHRIMYVCSDCSDNYPEGCGRYDHTELRVMPDGRWLCEECYDDDPMFDPEDDRIAFVSLPPPPEYGPLPDASRNPPERA